MNMDNPPGIRIPGNRQGGTTVPGSPRSGPCAETCVGPQPGGVLPAGTQSGIATAEVEEERKVRSLLDRYLGPGPTHGASTSAMEEDDNMSIADSIGKKRTRERESVSDSDVDLAPTKGRKVLWSRVIGSDSGEEEGPIVLSDSRQDISNKVRGRKARARRLDKLDKLDDSQDLSKVVFTECPARLSYEDLNNKDVDEIAATSDAWLNDMETVRFKSKKMNGKFSGVLKDRIICMRSIIKALVERVRDTGDVPYLRRKNDELASQLRESRKEERRLDAHLKEADIKIEKLSSEILELRKKITSRTAPKEVEDTPPPERSRSDSKTRIIRGGTPRRKETARASSVTESLHQYDERLSTILKCDEKIARYEEILKQMRTDLYGSLEVISEGINQTVDVADPPKKRGVPQIISNIQLVPPRPTPRQEERLNADLEYGTDGEGWTEVKSKKDRKSVRLDMRTKEPLATSLKASNENFTRRPPLAASGVRRRAPRAAAVSIKANTEGLTYAEIIKRAREGVNLKDLGITNPRMRRAANGGVIIEIAGPEGAIKADTLASRLREVIGDNASVSRPVVKADLRISGFDDSVIKDEIITVITEFGSCLASDIRVGQFRPLRNGLNLVWVQCPLTAAIKVSRRGKVNIGWSVARVELMKSRPVQCYRCWHFGHVRNNCDSPNDRTGNCFKCGDTNHTSYSCLCDPYCVICADFGHDTAHRLGSSACTAMTRRIVNPRSNNNNNNN